jgi:hypothetical protein
MHLMPHPNGTNQQPSASLDLAPCDYRLASY